MSALNQMERNALRQLNRISDAIFFSLLLPALVHYNDIIQRISLVAIYLAFQLDVLDAENVIHASIGEIDKSTIAKLRILTLGVLFTTFWISYILGMAYNVYLNRDGGGVAQAFSFVVMLNDVMKMFEISTFRKNDNQLFRIVVDFVVRFILLVCVFVETV
jgi:fumarate reductase subunit D